MKTSFSNKILQESEDKIEGQLLPDTRSNYARVVTAGMQAALKNGPHGMLAQIKDKPGDPLKNAAVGCANLVILLRAHTLAKMPVNAMIPAGMTLLLHALDFLGRVGKIEITEENVAMACRLYANAIFAKFKITQQMLANAASNVHGVMQDPTSMEKIARRAGTVRTPGASEPTPLPPGGGIINQAAEE